MHRFDFFSKRVSCAVRLLPRDDMHSAEYAFAKCLSVGQSIDLRYGVKAAKAIVEFTSQTDSPVIVLCS